VEVISEAAQSAELRLKGPKAVIKWPAPTAATTGAGSVVNLSKDTLTSTARMAVALVSSEAEMKVLDGLVDVALFQWESWLPSSVYLSSPFALSTAL